MDSLDYLRLLEDDATRDAAMSLVIAVIASDGVVNDDELRLLTQLDPRRTFDASAIKAAAPRDIDQIASAFTTDEARWRALRLAARVAWTDRQLASEEKALLVSLAATFGLPRDAVETVLDTMVGHARNKPSEADVRKAVHGMVWEELEFAATGPRSTLAAVAPSEQAIGVLTIEGVEVVALYPGGLVGSFREGDAFVPWVAIEEYSRIPVFGAAVRLDLQDGKTYTLVDVRVRPIGALLDRVFS